MKVDERNYPAFPIERVPVQPKESIEFQKTYRDPANYRSNEIGLESLVAVFSSAKK